MSKFNVGDGLRKPRFAAAAILGKQLSVCDQDLDKRFVMVDGEIVEDVETPKEEIVTVDIWMIHLL